MPEGTYTDFPFKIYLNFILDCLTDEQGLDYVGDMSVSRGGHTCLRWDSTTAASLSESPDWVFPHDSSRTEAENHCRNADNWSGPWCIVNGSGDYWDLCDIPTCFGKAR